ncbi:hypothetical protein JRO89_XS02G0217900 [Xanthoceras sorbifolium]|uniref:RNase H type-1 domain-containing protein n=1 Tax=Xanthoceras sorbifolium TaxID=99658 RepID=A0ABQ8IGI5_9ROSI|nr:hypothetical protein JRO89_XS02G0217900 [Xanthoceras sorbifolium]
MELLVITISDKCGMYFIICCKSQLQVADFEKLCIVFWRVCFYDDYISANEKINSSSAVVCPAAQPSGFAIRWHHPPYGFYKVNMDAAVDVSGLRIGLGFVIRDGHGLVLAAGSQPLHLYVSPQIAEALAILQVVRFASELGITPIMVESNALEVVNLIV